jgi:transcriptional regulator with XRE-family HTH domain
MRTWANPANEWHSEIPALLRKRRLDLGVSQGELARRLNVYQNRLSGWELGAIVPSVPFLFRWTAGLDLELALVGPREPSTWKLAEETAP